MELYDESFGSVRWSRGQALHDRRSESMTIRFYVGHCQHALSSFKITVVSTETLK